MDIQAVFKIVSRFHKAQKKSMLNLNVGWDEVANFKNPLLLKGKLLKKPELLFTKIDDATVKIQLEKLKNNIL